MMVPEAAIAQVVSEASASMHDAKYITGKVDGLARLQPSITSYVVAHQKELTTDGVVSVLFYAALIHESVRMATGRHPARGSYAALDAAARSAPNAEELARIEPDLASFIISNVELQQGSAQSAVARTVLCHLAAALVG